MKITITRTATLSMKKIFAYKKEFSGISQARKWRKSIYDKIKYLENNPQMGKKIDQSDDYPNEIRFLIESNYHIFYEYTGKQIFIIKVKDSRTNPDDADF